MKNSNSVKEIENKIFKQQKSMQQFVKNIDKVNKLKIRHNSNHLSRILQKKQSAINVERVNVKCCGLRFESAQY